LVPVAFMAPYTWAYPEYPSSWLTAFGYGRTDDGDCRNHNTSGAGVLRTAGSIGLTDFGMNVVNHDGFSYYGAEIRHGDSGGPIVSTYSGQHTILGVNSGVTVAAGSHNLFKFLYGYFGEVQISSFESPGTLLGGADSYLRTNISARSSDSRLTWTSSWQIKVNGKCLTDSGSNSGYVRLLSCSSSYGDLQKWFTQTGIDRISNVQTGRCMTRNGTYVTSTACSTAGFGAQNQRWRWVLDNDLD
jgi:hypothetical protein